MPSYENAMQIKSAEVKKQACLLAATQTEHQVRSGLLLNIVVAQCTAIFQLLACEDETLLIWWDALFVLNLRLHVVDRIGALNLKRDRLARQCLDEDLHTTSQAQNQVQRRLLLNVVVRESATILKLLASEDQALLVWWDTLLVLDLRLDVVDSVRGL